MVKDIIETRAELYRALHRSPRAESEEEEEEEEEEGGKEAMVNQEDLSLSEHLKLKESFLAGNISYYSKCSLILTAFAISGYR